MPLSSLTIMVLLVLYKQMCFSLNLTYWIFCTANLNSFSLHIFFTFCSKLSHSEFHLVRFHLFIFFVLSSSLKGTLVVYLCQMRNMNKTEMN